MPRMPNDSAKDVRFPVLKLVAAILSSIGWILLAVGTIVLFIGLYGLLAARPVELNQVAQPFGVPAQSGTSWLNTWIGGWLLFWSLGILVSGLQTLAFGKFLELALQVEKNTRKTARILEIMDDRLEPKTRDPVIDQLFHS